MLLNLREILEPTVEDNFAVGGFNVTENTTFKAIVEEAQCRETSAIIRVFPNEFQFPERELYLYFSVHPQRSRNPFVPHCDYSKSYEGYIRAIQAGSTFAMFDGSQMEYDQSMECTRRVVEAAHGVGVSVEGEIGTMGEAEDYLNGMVRDMVYTSPELTRRFVEDTGVDALAVSIDTVHGILPKGYMPKLQPGLLKELAAVVPVPLVLYGGSGMSHDEVAAACRTGIRKVNIFSEFRHAYYQSVREFATNHSTLINPTRVLKDAVQEVRDVTGTKMQMLGSTGKSHCYRKC